VQYVYLLRAGDNHYKVGVAKSVKSRVAGIQTSNPTKIHIVSTKLLEDAYATERELHARLKQWNVSGEWFELEPRQVIDLLIEIAKYPEPDLAMNVRLRDILADQSAMQKRIYEKLNVVTDLAKRQVDEKQAEREAARKEKEALNLMTPVPRHVESFEETVAKAIEVIGKEGKASTSLLQRHLSIGYGKAARVMDYLEQEGWVGPSDGAKARSVLSR
jgi:DNA segregation ATPase FtsK/SpoIIIE-like protein